MRDCCQKEQLINVWIYSGETHSSDGSSSSAGSCHTPHTAWRGSLVPYLLIKITKTAVAISADQNCHLQQQEGAGHLCLLNTAGSCMKNSLLTLEKKPEWDVCRVPQPLRHCGMASELCCFLISKRITDKLWLPRNKV